MLKPVIRSALLGTLLVSGSWALADPVATVNGEPISEDMLLLFQQQLGRNGNSVSREDALDQLINFVLVTQDAEKQGIDKRPNVVQDLAWKRRGLLVNISLNEYMQAHPITDEEIQAAYNKFKTTRSGQEYHARHILLKTEEEAKAVIKQLDEGADFAKLAAEKSIGPTKTKGGDLGWFTPDRMVKPFSEAVKQMNKGSYSKNPVKTQFGWHVILLEDSRDVAPPALDEVRKQLQTQLTQQRMQDYFEELRSKAKIDKQ